MTLPKAGQVDRQQQILIDFRDSDDDVPFAEVEPINVRVDSGVARDARNLAE